MPVHKHLLVVTAVLIAGLAMFFSWKALAPTSDIIFPAGSETLVTGQTYSLAWNGGPDPTHIFLTDTSRKENGTSVAISDKVYGVTNKGVYLYRIPSSLPEGMYEIQIGEEISKPFTIIQPFGYRCGDGTEFTLSPTLQKNELLLMPTTSVERFLKTTLYKKGVLYENGAVRLYPSGENILFSTRDTTTECKAMGKDFFRPTDNS